MPILNLHQADEGEAVDLRPWVKLFAPLALAALVAYFTSEIRSEAAMSRMEEREQNHYLELKQSIDLLRQDIRDLRNMRPAK